jgi:hypothetical protein
MSEICEKNNQANEENKKDNNPLSVRVDPYYKDLLEDLIKQKGVPKKALLETMILNYVESSSRDGRESNISFVNEINLIAGNLDEIMNIFKTITIKSQDTVGSQKSFYEQKVKNLETENKMLENNNSVLDEKNKLFDDANNEYLLERENFKKTISNLNLKDVAREKEVAAINLKNSELLEQINILQKGEKENIFLKIENEKLKHEIILLKSTLENKSFESEKLLKKVSALDESILEIKNKKADEFKELEVMIRKEAELDKKMEIIKLQSLYNELQAENLKNLGIINMKFEEITELKSKIEKRIL